MHSIELLKPTRLYVSCVWRSNNASKHGLQFGFHLTKMGILISMMTHTLVEKLSSIKWGWIPDSRKTTSNDRIRQTVIKRICGFIHSMGRVENMRKMLMNAFLNPIIYYLWTSNSINKNVCSSTISYFLTKNEEVRSKNEIQNFFYNSKNKSRTHQLTVFVILFVTIP